MVIEVDINHKDVLITFIHPPYPSRQFTWSSRDGKYWGTATNIVCKIATPALSGRHYCLHPDVLLQIDNLH